MSAICQCAADFFAFAIQEIEASQVEIRVPELERPCVVYLDVFRVPSIRSVSLPPVGNNQTNPAVTQQLVRMAEEYEKEALKLEQRASTAKVGQPAVF